MKRMSIALTTVALAALLGAAHMARNRPAAKQTSYLESIQALAKEFGLTGKVLVRDTPAGGIREVRVLPIMEGGDAEWPHEFKERVRARFTGSKFGMFRREGDWRIILLFHSRGMDTAGDASQGFCKVV